MIRLENIKEKYCKNIMDGLRNLKEVKLFVWVVEVRILLEMGKRFKVEESMNK